MDRFDELHGPHVRLRSIDGRLDMCVYTYAVQLLLLIHTFERRPNLPPTFPFTPSIIYRRMKTKSQY
jgi:hypothetical protein